MPNTYSPTYILDVLMVYPFAGSTPVQELMIQQSQFSKSYHICMYDRQEDVPSSAIAVKFYPNDDEWDNDPELWHVSGMQGNYVALFLGEAVQDE